MDTISFALVGAGSRGTTHLERIFPDIPGADVVALVEVDEEKARRVADEHDIPAVYHDYRDALEDDDVDVVDVCVHNNLHAPITIDALEAGKHVYCEKPMAGSYADAKRMYDAAEQTGKELAVQNHRLGAVETRAAKRLIEHGYLGEVYYGHAAYTRIRGRPYINGYATPAFVDPDAAGGGPVFDVGTYDIGQMLYLLGNPGIERVRGKTFQSFGDQLAEERTGDHHERYKERITETNYDMEDAGFGFVELADGSLLTIEAAWAMYSGESHNEVVGTAGGIDLNDFDFRTTMADMELSGTFDLERYDLREQLIDPDREGFGDEWENDLYRWVRALRGEEEYVPSAEIALESMLVMEGMYLSAELGREVTAEEIVERSESTAADL